MDGGAEIQSSATTGKLERQEDSHQKDALALKDVCQLYRAQINSGANTTVTHTIPHQLLPIGGCVHS